MKARLTAFWDAVQSSYWFIPSLMTLGAIALSFALTTLDGVLGPDWMGRVSWLYANKPEGARAVLSTIASSMIGVAGVTFSITIASVVYASGQYGPRLLTNFMRDRGNQVTLGTFIATFIYCLLVLRTVRDAQEESDAFSPADDVVGAFVPHVAILTGLVLALASIAVLIYFIHHIPSSIHVSNVLAGVGRDLERKVRALFPHRIGDRPGTPDDVARGDLPERFYEDAARVRADGSGYVQGVDVETVLGLATAHDLLLRLQHRPGDFVSDGDALLLVWPPEALSDELCRKLRRAYAWGDQRTPVQDARFLVNELVEIASRALSPGVNDPFTAITCIDWLGSALKALADADMPGAARVDETGRLRVIAHPTSFEEFVEAMFGQLRPYAAADVNAARRVLHALGEAAPHLGTDARRQAVRAEADALLAGAEAVQQVPADLETIRRAHRTVVRLLSGRAEYERYAAASPDVGGTA
ncbi:MAG: DUF2254 domain-containing protein [Rubricoccaceae bacterium]